jgi:hypothetical protein
VSRTATSWIASSFRRSDPRLQVSSLDVDREDRRRDPPATEAVPEPQVVRMAEFSKFAEEIIKLNDKNGHWDQKTQRQARSISNLFVRFMIQDQEVDDLNGLRQAHAGRFVNFLLFEIYQNYGKSPKDEHRTIAQLREIGLSHEKEIKPGEKSKCGIAGPTVNRHLTFLGQIFDYASARGLENLDKINLSKLRTKSDKDTRDRDERLKLPIERAMVIFQTAPFINCAGWDELGKWGEQGARQIFHCALYFVPILIYYTGARRERALRRDGG